MQQANEYAKTDAVLRSFLGSALKDIMAVCEAQGGSLFIFDSKNKELVLDSFYNSKNLHLKGVRQRLGEGVSGKVVQIEQPILVKDISTDSRFQRNGFKHYRTNSFISIPLLSSRGTVGLINLTDKADGQAFTDKDFECAVTFSKYFSTIIENLMLLTTLKNGWEAAHQQKTLLEKYASVGKLAAGVVHEINNPLDGIIRYTNMLLNQMEDNSLNREYLMEIKNGLNRIAKITRSLLDFSYQVNSSSSRAHKYVDLHTLIEDSLETLKAQINGDILVEKNYKRDLPRIADLNLTHVFVNVIRNALEAMPKGGKLEISTNIKDPMVEITIKDTGPGVPKEIMGHIFEPFFTTKGKDKGTGLGLAIAKGIIDKCKGRIEVVSFPGEGSCFTILIPKKYLENAQS